MKFGSSQSGVALVVVLWVVLVLSLLVSGFAFTMHVETQLASFSRNQLKAEAIARSGVEVARMQLILDQRSAAEAGFDALNQSWATNDFYFNHPLGDGILNVKVLDEESKIPINRATPEQLSRLLAALEVDLFDADVIVDSILDWIDDNDLHRLNGAEDEYYQSLSPPYRAKNAPLERIEELLLVRGVTPELFYGTAATEETPARPGLRDLLTTTSSGRVNVNTAPPIVLQALLGLDDVRVQAVLARRDGPDGIPGTGDDQPFRSVEEFFSLLGVVDPQILQRARELVDVNSTTFTVHAVGEVAGVKRTVVATLRRDAGNVQIAGWREQRGAR
jgi:general secretion pathway protein K